MFLILARTLSSRGNEFANISENLVLTNISESTVINGKAVIETHKRALDNLRVLGIN